jgi:hypothetical protein
MTKMMLMMEKCDDTTQLENVTSPRLTTDRYTKTAQKRKEKSVTEL